MSKAQQRRLKSRLLVCGLALAVSVAAAILLVVSANSQRAHQQAEREAAASAAQAAAESEAAAQAAAEEAGMSKPTSGQIQYIDLSGADTAVVYGAEPGIVEKTVTSVKNGVQSLWEYFR